LVQDLWVSGAHSSKVKKERKENPMVERWAMAKTNRPKRDHRAEEGREASTKAWSDDLRGQKLMDSFLGDKEVSKEE